MSPRRPDDAIVYLFPDRHRPAVKVEAMNPVAIRKAKNSDAGDLLVYLDGGNGYGKSFGHIFSLGSKQSSKSDKTYS